MKDEQARIAIKATARRSIRFSAALKIDDTGQDSAEYALLFAMLALSMVASIASLSELIANMFTHVGTSFSKAT